MSSVKRIARFLPFIFPLKSHHPHEYLCTYYTPRIIKIKDKHLPFRRVDIYKHENSYRYLYRNQSKPDPDDIESFCSLLPEVKCLNRIKRP